MWYVELIGMYVETLLVVSFLHLFSDSYGREKVCIAVGAAVIATIDTIQQWYFQSYVITFVINVSIITLWLKWMTKRRWEDIIFEFAATYIFVGVSQFLSIWIATTLIKQPLSDVFINMISLGLLITVIFLAGHPPIQNHFRIFYEMKKSILHLIVGNFFLISFLELYLWNMNRKIFDEEMGLVGIVLAAWGVMNFLLLNRMMDNEKQKELLFIHKNHIDTMESLLDQLHTEKHEFRKHLQTVLGLTGEREDIEELKEIREYINGWQTVTDGEQAKKNTYLTGNRVINALLDVKRMEADQAGISLMFVPGAQNPDFCCNEYELVEIVGNLLSNAFEAVMPLEKDKMVSLEIGMNGEKAFIRVKNPVPEEIAVTPDKFTQKGYSTKNGTQRGYGLYRVHQIVKKYQGTIALFKEGKWFVAEVSL